MASLTVCVIGAGALGLTAMKSFLEEGFEVTGFESRDYVGGLWKNSPDANISVHATTVFNSSKWRTAFSDFPFDDQADTYPTAEQIHHYLESYADQFRLRTHYQLATKVLHIVYQPDIQKWGVTVQDISSPAKKTRTVKFDKVCIATGAFHTPRWPRLKSLDSFQGRVLHSIDFHDGRDFQGQNVLLVGLHATAQDVCCALAAGLARHVYIAHRGGVLLLPRFHEDGTAFDVSGTLRMTFIMAFMVRHFGWLFWWLSQRAMVKHSKHAFSPIPDSWGLNPAPSVAVRTPLMADALWPLLRSNFAELVPSIRRICGPKRVEMTGGRVLDEIDAIIYCTGYHFRLPEGLLDHSEGQLGFNPYPPSQEENPVPLLYHNVFPLHENEAIRNSMAFLGHGYIPFPGLVQFEMTGAAVAQVWKGRTKLPSWPEMQRWHALHIKRRNVLQNRYSPLENSTFYPSWLDFEDQLRWIDETAGCGLYENMGDIGGGWFNWRAWRLWWRDRKLYRVLRNGLFTPAIWRLFDTGKRRAMDWETGKAMIWKENERADKDREVRLQTISTKKTV